ncbi:sister chromatid cohesion protein PDS5 homolog A-B [Dendrobium catenatum]|uniref:sister chromatid cohesion protein PDS5 homolog A-B n=1 Tax=Dendrobium catenatum TaxID=906689 RepID=UPI00109F9775|nr:sister chromatid cohesion protein PDS5 homolog A-B [Dendrobium catenatum]
MKFCVLFQKAEAALSDLSPSLSLQEVLTSLSCSLVQSNLRKHKDDDVRLLVAVCFTEVIRLLAPNPPCSYEVYKEIFRLIINVFKRLTDSNSPFSTRRLKILETVAYCKSFLIMLGGCEDLSAEMFDVLFKAVRFKIQDSLMQAIMSIMTSILEQQVSPRILYVILHNLLRQEKAASFRLAVSVIQDCAPKLETHVCSFLTSCMLDKYNVDKRHETDSCNFDGDNEHDDALENDAPVAELRSSYHEVFLKIYQYAPQILTSILPLLTQELLIDQVDARMKAVQLVGKLMVLSKLNFGREHRPVYSEFLRRFSDKSADVRLASLEWAKAVYQANASADEARCTLVAVEGRLLDFDDKVRTQAISVICNLASSNLSCFSSEFVLKAIKRLRDKKISVRKSAMQSLLELYRVYCIKCSNGLFSLNFTYENIPGAVLMLCFDKDCKEFRAQNMELVITRDLFPSSLSVTDRKNHWIALFSLLTQPHLKALKFILFQKRRLQLEMQAYLALRVFEKETESEEVQIKLLESFSKVATCFFDSSKAKECLQKLHNMKDGFIFKLLQQLVDEHTTLAAANSIRDSFLERIGKKHPDNEFFRIFSLRCSYTIFNAELVQSILEDIFSRQGSGDKSVEYSIELLLFIVKLFPSLLKGSEDLLLKLFFDTSVFLAKEKLLHILAIAGHHVPIKLSDVYPFLEKICLLGTRVESKFAVQAISSLIDSSDDHIFSSLCQKLVRSLQCGQNIPTILQSLSFVACHSFRIYKLHEKEVTDFIFKNIFVPSELYCAVEESFLKLDCSCSSYCKLKIYGLKTLFKSFLSNEGSELSQHIKETLTILENTVQGEGIIYYNISGEIDKDCLRLTAAKLLLRFATRFDSFIPSKIFHLIIARARDPSHTVRKTFLHKVYQLLKENKIPLRYACTFTLASTDFVGDVRVNSIKYLAEVIDRCRRDSFNQNSSSQDDRRQIVNTPEYVVVFLIHILAHDQGFPSERLEDKDFYPEFCNPLVILLRALVDLEDFNGNRSDMLLNLLAILRAIKKADDANDAHITPKLHVLSDIAMLILKLLGKGLKPTSKLQRMILLPSSFYKVRQDSSKVYDLNQSFFDENFAKRILDVVDSSIMKPYKSSSKQCAKPPQVGANYISFMKDNSEDLFEAEEIKPLVPKSKLTKDIEHNHGNALDKDFSSAQPSQSCSVFTYWHNENSDVQGRPNFFCQNYDANLGDELLSSCNSASTECYFSGLQPITAEGEVEVLNPLLTKRIAKCDSISFLCDQDPVPDNCLTSKESAHKGNGLLRRRICNCPAVGICSYSGSIDSCDSQQNSYKASDDNGSVELLHLDDARWESVVQKPSMDKHTCGFQPRDCKIVENASNMQRTVLGESARNYEHVRSPAIFVRKKAKRQRQKTSSAMAKDSYNLEMVDKNVCKAARRTQPRRI